MTPTILVHRHSKLGCSGERQDVIVYSCKNLFVRDAGGGMGSHGRATRELQNTAHTDGRRTLGMTMHYIGQMNICSMYGSCLPQASPTTKFLTVLRAPSPWPQVPLAFFAPPGRVLASFAPVRSQTHRKAPMARLHMDSAEAMVSVGRSDQDWVWGMLLPPEHTPRVLRLLPGERRDSRST
jgi:hypothetical protein